MYSCAFGNKGHFQKTAVCLTWFEESILLCLYRIVKQVFFCRPLLPRGVFAFTRLFSLFTLKTWIGKTCFPSGIKFVDNFNPFWNCKEFFRPNNIEFSWIGTKVLADHYSLFLSPSRKPIFLQPTGSLADECSQTDPVMDINKNSAKPKQLPLQA